MGSRIIINNETKLTDAEALALVSSVVAEGKVSSGRFGEQYCYATVYKTENIAILCTKQSQNTDTFLIVEETPQ